MSQQNLEAGFKAWQDALNRGDMETFFAAMDDDIVIYDEDIPWRLSKADMIDHLSFHARVWDTFEWVPRELRFQTRGDTGIVSGFATFRGKPKDAGFRQRFMGLTQTWMRKGTGWTMLSCIRGHSTGSSTGPRQPDDFVHPPMHSVYYQSFESGVPVSSKMNCAADLSVMERAPYRDRADGPCVRV